MLFAKKRGRILLLAAAAFAGQALGMAALAQALPLPQAKPIKTAPLPLPKTAMRPSRQKPMRQIQHAVNPGQKLGDIKEETPLLPPPPREFGLPLPKAPAQKAPPQAAIPAAVSIGSYPLNEALLSRVEKIHAEILSLPEPEEEDDSDDDIRGGVDILIKAMEKRPDIMSILGRNLISAQDYITATQALANALANASGAEEGQVFGENSKISPANLAFGKKYAGRIRKLLEE